MIAKSLTYLKIFLKPCDNMIDGGSRTEMFGFFHFIFRLNGERNAFPVGRNKKDMSKFKGEMYETHPELVAFYGTSKWKKCRAKYKSLHPVCERCEAAGIIKRTERIHHKVYLTPQNFRDPDISLNFDNLEALCFDCHQAEHNKKKDCREELFFDADGNIRKS